MRQSLVGAPHKLLYSPLFMGSVLLCVVQLIGMSLDEVNHLWLITWRENQGMKLFDKLVLALKSAVNDVVGEDVAPRGADKAGVDNDNTLRLIEKAQARIDILRKDADRADKRGDAELANKIRKEAEGLQKTVDKTRRRLGQVTQRESAITSVEAAQAARKEQARARNALDARDEAAANREDTTAARDKIDQSRISDLLKNNQGPKSD